MITRSEQQNSNSAYEHFKSLSTSLYILQQ